MAAFTRAPNKRDGWWETLSPQMRAFYETLPGGVRLYDRGGRGGQSTGPPRPPNGYTPEDRMGFYTTEDRMSIYVTET